MNTLLHPRILLLSALAATVGLTARVEAQEQAQVSAAWLRDPVHGSQAVVQDPLIGSPVNVGVPASLIIDFDFALAPNVDVRKLDVRWSVLDAQGEVLAVIYESGLGGPIVPHVWYGGGRWRGRLSRSHPSTPPQGWAPES